MLFRSVGLTWLWLLDPVIGPGDATRTVVQHLYETAFQNFFHFGSASAMAWVLFVIILAFSLLQFRLLRGHTQY